MSNEFSKWFEQYALNNEYAAEQIALDGYQLGLKQRQTEVDELQKRVDAVKQLIQDYLGEEKELELKEWEQSTIYGRIAIELEQALKGEA